MLRLREAAGKMRCTVIHQVLTQLAVFFNTSKDFERVYSRSYYVSPFLYLLSNIFKIYNPLTFYRISLGVYFVKVFTV